MQRVFAHRIIFEGKSYDSHVVELDDSGRVSVFPFREEIHSTVFVSGTIEVKLECRPDPVLVWRSVSAS